MPSSGPCCCGVPEMPTKHVATRATAARAACVRIRLGQSTPFSMRGSVPAAEDDHRGAHHKQDQRHRASSLQEQGIRDRLLGDPIHNCRQASYSQLLTN